MFAPESSLPINVWQVSLDQPSERLTQYTALLSPDEATRAARFRFTQHRDRYIAARGQLRLLLAEALQQPPKAITVAYSEHRKPYIPDSSIAFNIAHAGDLTVCAITTDHAVGIDLEDIRREVEIMSVARAFFAPDEIAWLSAASPPEQRRLFFHLWTRKEAYLKARGIGLKRDGLNTLIPTENAVSFVADDESRWSVISFTPTTHTRAALVTSANIPSIRLRVFDGEIIVED